MLSPASPDTDLSFSVIVPTHRRPVQLARCLQALALQDFPRSRYEVIVINDGACAETERSVAAQAAASDMQVRSISQPQTGPALARNAGGAVARGRFLAFTDDDCAPKADWLSRLEPHLTAHGSIIVGGRTLNALPTLLCSTASQLLVDFLYDYHRRAATGARFFTTNNMAVHAREFRESGGFDVTFPLAGGEDREFCERWQRRGGTLVFAADALVDHWHQLRFWRYVRQHFSYGRGAEFLRRSRARLDAPTWRPRVEPPAFYIKLVTCPFGRVAGRQAVPLSLLMLVSQTAYVAGYLFQRAFRIHKPQRRQR